MEKNMVENNRAEVKAGMVYMDPNDESCSTAYVVTRVEASGAIYFITLRNADLTKPTEESIQYDCIGHSWYAQPVIWKANHSSFMILAIQVTDLPMSPKDDIGYGNLYDLLHTMLLMNSKVIDLEIIPKDVRTEKTFWTEERQKAFINIYDNYGVEFVAKVYGLAESTAYVYAGKFRLAASK